MDASPNIIFGINTLIRVSILTTFLVVLFKYGSKFATNEIHRKVSDALNLILPSVFDLGGSTLTTAIQSIKVTGVMDRLQKYFGKENPVVITNNKGLFSSAFITVLAICLLTFVSIMLLTKVCGINIDIGVMLRDNIVLFIIVGIIEYIFFMGVTLHYIPFIPSDIMQQVLDTLKQDLK